MHINYTLTLSFTNALERPLPSTGTSFPLSFASSYTECPSLRFLSPDPLWPYPSCWSLPLCPPCHQLLLPSNLPYHLLPSPPSPSLDFPPVCLTGTECLFLSLSCRSPLLALPSYTVTLPTLLFTSSLPPPRSQTFVPFPHHLPPSSNRYHPTPSPQNDILLQYAIKQIIYGNALKCKLFVFIHMGHI